MNNFKWLDPYSTQGRFSTFFISKKKTLFFNQNFESSSVSFYIDVGWATSMLVTTMG